MSKITREEVRKARKKPVEIEFYTFDDLVGKKRPIPTQKWHIEVNGYPITHENDELLLISTLEGTMNMTPKDVLIVGVKGEIYPCKIDIFYETYEVIK